MRLIDADALIEFWKADFTEEERSKLHIPLNVAIENLSDAPTVDAVERKHGRWIDETFEPYGLVFHPYKCDQCGEHNDAPSDYCPNCGADMRGENNG